MTPRIITIPEFVAFLLWMPPSHQVQCNKVSIYDKPLQGPLVHFGLHNGIDFENAYLQNWVIGTVTQARFKIVAQLEVPLTKIIPIPQTHRGPWPFDQRAMTYSELTQYIDLKYLPQ